jgi:hypothetical protein
MLRIRKDDAWSVLDALLPHVPFFDRRERIVEAAMAWFQEAQAGRFDDCERDALLSACSELDAIGRSTIRG